jgi:hypothetical protein
MIPLTLTIYITDEHLMLRPTPTVPPGGWP